MSFRTEFIHTLVDNRLSPKYSTSNAYRRNLESKKYIDELEGVRIKGQDISDHAPLQTAVARVAMHAVHVAPIINGRLKTVRAQLNAEMNEDTISYGADSLYYLVPTIDLRNPNFYRDIIRSFKEKRCNRISELACVSQKRFARVYREFNEYIPNHNSGPTRVQGAWGLKKLAEAQIELLVKVFS